MIGYRDNKGDDEDPQNAYYDDPELERDRIDEEADFDPFDDALWPDDDEEPGDDDRSAG